MKAVEIFDVLNAGRFSYLETKSGGIYGGRVLTVGYATGEAAEPATIKVEEDGLSLSFNAKADGGTKGVFLHFDEIAFVRA